MQKKTTPPGKHQVTAHDSAAPDAHDRVTLPDDLQSFSRLASPKPRSAQDAPTAAPPRMRGDSADEGPEVEVTGIEDEEPIDPASEERPILSLSLPPPRSEQPTITNEFELEDARRRSAALSTAPPRRPTPYKTNSLLSMANAASDLDSGWDDDDDAGSNTPTAPPPPEALKAMERAGRGEPIVEMRDRFSLGDYTGALEIADEILGEQPGEPEAMRCAEDCRAVLVKMYTARIGPLDKVPIVLVPKNQLRWLSIDHRAGFVLSHIDGVSSLEMVLDVSGMLPLDCLRILFELVQQRVIAFR
jgi:hypothetical protein